MTQLHHSISLRVWGLLLFLSLLWGGSYMFIGVAVRELPPLVIVLARVVLASLVLVPLHLATQGPLPKDKRSWIAFAGMSLLNNVIPFSLIVTGQTMIASGVASVINATTPMFGAAFLAFAGEEPLIARKAVGLAAGLIGVAVLHGADLSSAGGQSLGMALCLAAAASYGLSAVWVKRRLTGIPALTIATGQLVCSTAAMAVLAMIFDRPSSILGASVEAWAAIAALAVLSTALAYVVYFRIVAAAGPAAVMLVTMLIPVSAIALGHLFLAEVVTYRELLGAAIIGCALAVFDGRVLARFRPSRARQDAA